MPALASQEFETFQHITGAQAAVVAMADTWVSVLQAMDAQLDALTALQKRYGQSGGALSVLQAYLASGRISEALHQFLAANLGANLDSTDVGAFLAMVLAMPQCDRALPDFLLCIKFMMLRSGFVEDCEWISPEWGANVNFLCLGRKRHGICTHSQIRS